MTQLILRKLDLSFSQLNTAYLVKLDSQRVIMALCNCRCVSVLTCLLYMLQYLFSRHIAVLIEWYRPHTQTHIHLLYCTPEAAFMLRLSWPPRKAIHKQKCERCWENNYANFVFPTENERHWQSLYSSSSFFFESKIKIILTYHFCPHEKVRT